VIGHAISASSGAPLLVDSKYYFVSCVLTTPSYKDNSRYASTVTRSFPLEWARKTQQLLDSRSAKGLTHMVVRLLSYSEITYEQYLEHHNWVDKRKQTYDDQG
jgi:glycerol-3-phosphate dehydrogenase